MSEFLGRRRATFFYHGKSQNVIHNHNHFYSEREGNFSRQPRLPETLLAPSMSQRRFQIFQPSHNASELPQEVKHAHYSISIRYPEPQWDDFLSWAGMDMPSWFAKHVPEYGSQAAAAAHESMLYDIHASAFIAFRHKPRLAHECCLNFGCLRKVESERQIWKSGRMQIKRCRVKEISKNGGYSGVKRRSGRSDGDQAAEKGS